MEGGPERTNVSFRPSASAANEWTFKMTPGDLTVDIEFTRDFPDPANASLSAIYPGAGSLIPDFTKDNFNYTIAVPFGTAQFSVSALPENPYLAPEMLPEGGSGDNLLDADLMASENGGPLPEGSSKYEITLTSEDGSVENTYNIDVILLPDLSLKTFQVTKADKDFTRDLAPQDEQNVYLPYYEGLDIVAESADGGASVSVSPSTAVSGLNPITPAVITITVSKGLSGVEAKYTGKSYVLNLYYGEGMGADPLASGGYVSFIPGEDGAYYEVHTFMDAGEYELSFVDKSMQSVQADYLIVAGGGGAGASCKDVGYDRGGGGGAGGLLYETTQELSLAEDPVLVTVGEGGAGGAANSNEPGTNGGNSSIGTITAYGGGGGGIGTSTGNNAAGKPASNGKNGGSGGGSGALNGFTYGNAGSANPAGQGHNGGTAGPNSGGGGGGAGNAGGSVQSDNVAGAGGAGWRPTDHTADWIAQVTGTVEFSHGGRGGSYPATAVAGGSGVNYGAGGSGGDAKAAAGGSGGSGIVIVRFKRTVTVAAPETPEAPAE